MSRIFDLNQHGIYPDLLREFTKNGHYVTVAAPAERRFNENTNMVEYNNYRVLRIKVGNLQKTNVIEKGISTVLLESQFLSAIKQYCNDVKFDLVMYSTPPITFGKVIDYIRKRDNAKTYLLLKDIFPQNAVDLGMFSKKSIFYAYFRMKEKQLYKQSDFIGCMSQANVDYVIRFNRYIDEKKVHIAPNSIEVISKSTDSAKRDEVRKKYGIPLDTTVFVYGGNLGKPQDIPFVIKCLKANKNKSDRFFVICGTGTEYGKLKAFVDEDKPENILLINGLPKEEYEDFIVACDVGLIFLDHRFTIPNFPSRILSYMENSMPVLACTDANTDVGTVTEDAGFGMWCVSDSTDNFCGVIEKYLNMPLDEKKTMGKKGYEYLKSKFSVESCYATIISKLSNK